MPEKSEPITAHVLDAMSPDERSEAFQRGLITDLDELPEDFRTRVVSTAERLGRERRTTTTN